MIIQHRRGETSRWRDFRLLLLHHLAAGRKSANRRKPVEFDKLGGLRLASKGAPARCEEISHSVRAHSAVLFTRVLSASPRARALGSGRRPVNSRISSRRSIRCRRSGIYFSIRFVIRVWYAMTRSIGTTALSFLWRLSTSLRFASSASSSGHARRRSDVGHTACLLVG